MVAYDRLGFGRSDKPDTGYSYDTLADAVVPFEGSGQRTHRAVPHSQLLTVSGAPHGFNVSHAQAFNEALLAFLRS